MKKTLLLILISLPAFAQTGKIAENILKLQKENTAFTYYSPFAVNENPGFSDYTKTVDNATIATLNPSVSARIMAENKNYIEIDVPYNNTIITVSLYKTEVFAEGFEIRTSDAPDTKRTVETGHFYRGIIKGDSHSLVSFNFFNGQMNGIISGHEYRNIVVNKLNIKGNTTNYIVYSDAKLKIDNTFKCAVTDKDLNEASENTQNRTTLSDRCITVYFEIDHDMYVANGSDVDQTNIWMTSAFNNVQTLYNNDGISVAIKSIYVWTTPDPYTGDASWQYLEQFHAQRPVFNGDVGQLIGMDSGLGGVAAVIDGLCSGNNYSYSDVFFDFNTVPVMSWTIEVITHELGHLFGSPHTHGCYWNGDGSAIDGCAPTANIIYAEGNCPIGDVPLPEVGGTIMSYCHLLEGVGINFANGFGPQPAARILQNVNASSCLSTDCINTCISQVHDLIITNVTYNSATALWTDADITNSNWEIAVTTYPYQPTTWTPVTTNPYVIIGLSPNTNYDICVRSLCSPELQAVPKCYYFTTAADFCVGQPFVDSGGLDNNYSDYEDWIRTVAPINPNDKIKVVFNSIAIEQGWDFLYIFDGPDIESPFLTSITGFDVVGPFESTHASGALTFQFDADTNTNFAGWDAAFSCLHLGTEQNGLIDFSYYPNPTTGIINIKSKNEIQSIAIYSLDGKLLDQFNGKQLDATVDLSSYATGTYVCTLQFEKTATSFKVVRK
jgi:metallopeptidase family M12-like protein/type IX secretion system substrate protein